MQSIPLYYTVPYRRTRTARRKTPPISDCVALKIVPFFLYTHTRIHIYAFSCLCTTAIHFLSLSLSPFLYFFFRFDGCRHSRQFLSSLCVRSVCVWVIYRLDRQCTVFFSFPIHTILPLLLHINCVSMSMCALDC